MGGDLALSLGEGKNVSDQISECTLSVYAV